MEKKKPLSEGKDGQRISLKNSLAFVIFIDLISKNNRQKSIKDRS